MSKVAIVTDSNSGITQSEAKEYGVTVMPMPFFINDQTYYEDIDLTQEDFYETFRRCQYFNLHASCRKCDRHMG